jgi:hypothetical protein
MLYTFLLNGRVSEWLLYNAKWVIFSYIMTRTSYIRWNDNDIRFVLDRHASLDFYSASSPKQHSVGRHITLLRHIIPIPSQPVFTLSHQCCMTSRKATSINFMVFGKTRSELEPTIYCIWGEHANHYTTDDVKSTMTRVCTSLYTTNYVVNPFNM